MTADQEVEIINTILRLAANGEDGILDALEEAFPDVAPLVLYEMVRQELQ